MKLDENRRERLELLAGNLSLDYEGDELIGAVLNAVDEALGEAFSYLRSAYNDIMVETADNNGARLYFEILSENTAGLNAQEAEALLCDRMSRQYGDYHRGEFLSALKQLNPLNNIMNWGDGLLLRIDTINNVEELLKVGKYLSDYIPPFFKYYVTTIGSDFGQLEELSATWYQLDKADIPFYISDKLIVRRKV